MSHATTNASAAAAAEAAAYLINIPVGPDTWSDGNKLGTLLEKVKRINQVFQGRKHEIVLGLNQATGRGCNPIKLSDDTKRKIKEAKVKYHEFDWQKPKDKDGQAKKRDGKVIRGASIRLAELIANCYGNIRTVARIINKSSNQ